MYNRKCPKCKKKLSHTQKHNRDSASKKLQPCRSCSAIERNLKYGNPFQDKKHSNKTKKIIKKKRLNQNMSYMQNDAYKEKQRGSKNGMFGKSIYDVWKKKFGKDIADQKLDELKRKISKSLSGKNNPMFGRPSPTGSGNGWCGWYNEWHFRSLLELSYMINVIERFNLKWETAEQKKYSVPYKYQDTDHTYYPDFVIADKYVIDCKPKDLQNSELNIVKKKYAIKHFCKLGLKFKYVKCRRLNESEILKLYKEQKIKFIERYEIKFREKYE